MRSEGGNFRFILIGESDGDRNALGGGVEFLEQPLNFLLEIRAADDEQDRVAELDSLQRKASGDRVCLQSYAGCVDDFALACSGIARAAAHGGAAEIRFMAGGFSSEAAEKRSFPGGFESGKNDGGCECGHLQRLAMNVPMLGIPFEGAASDA